VLALQLLQHANYNLSAAQDTGRCMAATSSVQQLCSYAWAALSGSKAQRSNAAALACAARSSTTWHQPSS
jgi:hypothetical protein